MWIEYLLHCGVSIVASVLVMTHIIIMMVLMMMIHTGAFLFPSRTSIFYNRARDIKRSSRLEKGDIRNSIISPELKPWICNVTIDYSAANEFINAHYGAIDGSNTIGHDTYFPSPATSLESVYNARLGVYDDKTKQRKPATMPSCGFTLLSNVSTISTEDQVDWTNRSEIEKIYLPQLRELIMQQEWGRDATLSHVIFWHPLLRGVDAVEITQIDNHLQQQQPLPQSQPPQPVPRSGYVSTAHIDTDVGAYTSVDHFLSLIEKNRAPNNEPFPRKEIHDALQHNQRRFAIVNAWRNIDQEQPVLSNPLAVMATRYDQPYHGAFPDTQPNHETSRWYTFPYMKSDELLLFYQYDRDCRNPSDIWHVALTGVHDVAHTRRKSIEVRCFLVFHNTVPKYLDRFRDDRRQSKLSYQQSGTFAPIKQLEGASKRNKHNIKGENMIQLYPQEWIRLSQALHFPLGTLSKLVSDDCRSCRIRHCLLCSLPLSGSLSSTLYGNKQFYSVNIILVEAANAAW